MRNEGYKSPEDIMEEFERVQKAIELRKQKEEYEFYVNRDRRVFEEEEEEE